MSRNDDHFEFDAGWIFPIIMTIAFWPIGLFLLLKKYRESRSRSHRTKNYAPLISGGGLMTIIGVISGGVTGVFMAIGGAVLTLTSLFGNRKNSRLERTYLNIIGAQPVISIKELARITGRNKNRVMKDLQKMLDNNILPENAYIDHSAKCLVMDPEVLRGASRQSVPDDEPIVAEVVEEPSKSKKKPAEQAKAASESKQEDPAAKEAAILQETFDAKLREIRYWNEQIDDETVSSRIDDIESITANIFYLVREKPERASEIRTFMNYYLPTTLKLLKAYARLEKQSVAGDNIKSSRQEIERILDKLTEGFRQQLDRLFQADAIDISSDIDVLETMMAKDGLLNEMKIR